MRLAGIGLGVACKSGGGRGRYWNEVGAVHLSDQINRLKVRGLWWRVMLVDCCGWMVNEDGVLYRNTLENSTLYVNGTWV